MSAFVSGMDGMPKSSKPYYKIGSACGCIPMLALEKTALAISNRVSSLHVERTICRMHGDGWLGRVNMYVLKSLYCACNQIICYAMILETVYNCSEGGKGLPPGSISTGICVQTYHAGCRADIHGHELLNETSAQCRVGDF